MSGANSAWSELQTMADFSAFFTGRGLPCRVVTEAEPFLRVLRLVVSGRCKRGCHHPDGSVVWCHAEGITDRSRHARGLPEMLEAARWLRAETGIDRVKIAGLEPRFDDAFLPFIRGLRDAGFKAISLTTHDDALLPFLTSYRDAGLTQLSVSIPHLEEDEFSAIAYTGTAGGLTALVRHAKQLGLAPVKVNRVLQRGHTRDMPQLLQFVRDLDISVKLFDLMWTRNASDHHDRYLVRWTEFADLWLDDVAEVTLLHYPVSYRTRVCFKLRTGGTIEANLMDDKHHARSSICHDCELSARCAEGYLGCGVRVLPDLTVLPCLLRPELALDIAAALDPLRGDHPRQQLDELVAGRPAVAGSRPPTRRLPIVGAGDQRP